MVFWPWATNFRSIAHERRISDMEWVHWAVEQQWVCLVIISQIPELSRSKEACNVRIFTLSVTSAGVTIASINQLAKDRIFDKLGLCTY